MSRIFSEIDGPFKLYVINFCRVNFNDYFRSPPPPPPILIIIIILRGFKQNNCFLLVHFFQELIELLKSEAVKFKEVDCSVIAVTSACELFLRF